MDLPRNNFWSPAEISSFSLKVVDSLSYSLILHERTKSKIPSSINLDWHRMEDIAAAAAGMYLESRSIFFSSETVRSKVGLLFLRRFRHSLRPVSRAASIAVFSVGRRP
jgi:hypothetical protein